MRAAIGLEHLGWVPKIALAVALTAWSSAFLGMLDQARRTVHRSRTRSSVTEGSP
jgi:hypothetical protein